MAPPSHSMEVVLVLVRLSVKVTVVGDDNKEKVVPYVAAFQAVDQITQCGIGVGKGILDGVVEAFFGNNPGFVA